MREAVIKTAAITRVTLTKHLPTLTLQAEGEWFQLQHQETGSSLTSEPDICCKSVWHVWAEKYVTHLIKVNKMDLMCHVLQI